MKSGYLRISNVLARAITRDLTREFFFEINWFRVDFK